MRRRWWQAAMGLLALSPITPAAHGTTELSPFAATLLAGHNHERALVGVPPLRWDDDLARDASVWAAHLAQRGTLVHSVDDPSDPDPEGENLWAGTRGYYHLDDMVELWAAEKRNYRPAPTPANSRTGDFEDVGHYTQMVWRSSRAVGCALAHGRADDILVCRYSEGGNVIGERAF